MGTVAAVVNELKGHAWVGALGVHVLDEALRARSEQDTDFGAKPLALNDELRQALEGQMLNSLGSPLEALGHPASPEARQLIPALLGVGLNTHFPESDAEVDGVADAFVWLSANTSVDPLPALDAALGERAEQLWRAIARLAATRGQPAPDAGGEAADVTPNRLRGELHPAPRGPVATTVLGLTGILLLLQLLRLIGRFAFAHRRPAELLLSPRGLELQHRTELLGRVLRDADTLVPLSNLARVSREVRFSSAGLYAGLAALTLGSYLGVGLFVDGLRVPGGSASLLGLGALLVLVGLALDFGLSSVSDAIRGTCRIVVIPVKGKPFCVTALDRDHADAMLRGVAETLAAGRGAPSGATGSSD